MPSRSRQPTPAAETQPWDRACRGGGGTGPHHAGTQPDAVHSQAPSAERAGAQADAG